MMGRIAQNLLASLSEQSQDLTQAAKQFAQGLPDELPTPEELAEEGYDSQHILYIRAQNFASLFAEFASELDEFAGYSQIVEQAEKEYMPSMPPMSPITQSFFWTWALFDLRFGPDQEMVGSCLLELLRSMQAPEDMLSAVENYSNSRMGIYQHCGKRGSQIRLRELVTGDELLCHSASGYRGRKKELWFVRLAPPLSDDFDYHIAVTTPYVLTEASAKDWTAFLNKHLIGAKDKRPALHDLLKYGNEQVNWMEFVFQAYHHYQYDAVFLAGLPDVQASLPHSLTDDMPKEEASADDVIDAKIVAKKAIYQFKITLVDSDPPIWRRIESEDCTLAQFHCLIQDAMGWENSHLHEFNIAGERYAAPSPFEEMGPMDSDAKDASTVRLSQLISGQKKFHCRYLYDFGDSWEHLIQLEEVHAAKTRARYPRCTDGERACPPEDCGGIYGFYDFVEAITNRKHPEHRDMMEWHGPFKPDSFDKKKATCEMRR